MRSSPFCLVISSVSSWGRSCDFENGDFGFAMVDNYTHQVTYLILNFEKIIKATAKESGFKSAESFSKSFYKVYGIYPSFYLKQLESKEEIN